MIILGFTLMNMYLAIVQGNFRNRHAGCHSIVDMAALVGGPIVKETVGVLFLVAYICKSGLIE